MIFTAGHGIVTGLSRGRHGVVTGSHSKMEHFSKKSALRAQKKWAASKEKGQKRGRQQKNGPSAKKEAASKKGGRQRKK